MSPEGSALPGRSVASACSRARLVCTSESDMRQQPGTGKQDVTGELDIVQGDVLQRRMEVGVVG